MARKSWIAVARIAALGAPALAAARRRLGPIDRRRYVRIRTAKRRREFLAGRALLQQVGIGLPFDTDPAGGVKMSGGFGASLSHARGWVACVIVTRGRAGIDVEPMLERDFARMAEWVEADGGGRLEPKPDLRRGFYRLWTRYEARLKAFGDARPRATHAERTYFLPGGVALSVCAPANLASASILKCASWSRRSWRKRSSS